MPSATPTSIELGVRAAGQIWGPDQPASAKKEPDVDRQRAGSLWGACDVQPYTGC